MVYEGGCACGRIRYRIEGEPLSAGYCHCRMCQRAAGAPVVAWVAFRRADFRFVKGMPEGLQASSRTTRRSCPGCGGVLTFEYAGGTETVDVTIASLDDPACTQAIYDIWSASKLSPGLADASRDI